MLNEVKPYFFISNYNSIRFAKQVEWDNYNEPKKITNTLSYQEDGVNSKDFFQLFQFNDAVRIQFQSSYANHTIKLMGCESEVEIIPEKRTNYLNIRDSRYAEAISDNGKYTIYFGSGPIFDYDTGEIIDSYNLYQYVPSWMKVGKNILVDGVGEMTIEKIVWLSEFEMYAVQTNVDSEITSPEQITVKSIYNKFEYEIWEFDIDFYSFPEGKYQIGIIANDESFENKFKEEIQKSERIYLKETHEKTHLIIYENSKNTQINYSWGIQHMLRLQYEDTLKYSPEGENEIHKTDSNTYLLNESTFETYEISISPLPTAMASKIVMAFSCDALFVDTRHYVCDAKPTVERLGSSNLYDVKSKLILGVKDYRNKSFDFSKLPTSKGSLLDLENGGRLKNTESSFVFVD